MEKYLHKVNYYETDKMGITHHSNYVRIMEEARLDFFNQIGWSYAKFEEEGVISPVVSISCEYKKTTTFPDEIYVQVKVQKLSVCKLVLEYEFTVGGEIVFTATSSHCFLGKDGKPVVMTKQYPEFYKKLSELQ